MINRDETKRIVKITVFVLIATVVVLYSFFSFRDYIAGPEILITYPENGSTISTSTVTIQGQAIHIRDIELNKKPILLDKQGNFTNTILLHPGYNVSVITAKDKFNRTTEYKLELVYQDGI
jgi:hypothetical protein